MSYYKKRKIKESLVYMKAQGFEGTNLVDTERMSEELSVGEIPTRRQIEQIVDGLKERKSIPYSDPNFKHFQKFQRQGVRLPKDIKVKTEQYKRRKTYLNKRIEEVRILLRDEGFYKTENFNPTSIQMIPSNRQIYQTIDRLKKEDTITSLPLFLNNLEKSGVVIPSDIRVKLATGLAKDFEGDYGDLYEEATMGVVSNLNDYFDLAVGNPESIEINGNIFMVGQLQHEIYQFMNSRLVDVPRGNRFMNEYYTYMDMVGNMTNNQIIALFGIYDTGLFLNNLTDYDSEGDKINTRGMKQMMDDITTALSF